MMFRIYLLGAVFLSSIAFAKRERTLIRLDESKPVPALAKSWEKQEKGKFSFVLDLTKDIRRKTPVTAEFVKASLEAKLKDELSLTVVIEAKDRVVIQFQAQSSRAGNFSQRHNHACSITCRHSGYGRCHRT